MGDIKVVDKISQVLGIECGEALFQQLTFPVHVAIGSTVGSVDNFPEFVDVHFRISDANADLDAPERTEPLASIALGITSTSCRKQFSQELRTSIGTKELPDGWEFFA